MEVESVNRSERPMVFTPVPVGLPQLRNLTLDNGVPLRIYDRSDMETTSINVCNRGGVAEAPNAETAVMAAEMRSYGTENLSGEQIADALELKGAIFKSACSTHYTTSGLMTLSDKISSVLPIAAEAVLHSAFPEKETEIVAARKAEECEIMQTTEMFKMKCRIYELTAGFNNPCTCVPLAEDFRSVSAVKIASFYNSTQHPSNLCIYAYGRITPAIEDEINKAFGTPQASVPATRLNIVPVTPQCQDYYEHISMTDSVQTALGITIPTIPRSHPDYLALRLAVMALGGYFGSRLQQNIREEKGLTYGISAALLGFQEGTFASIITSCNSDYVDKVREEIFKEIALLSSHPLSQEELTRLKLAEIGNLMDVTDSPAAIIDFFKIIHTQDLPDDYFERRISAVNRIDPDTIMRVTREHLSPDKAITISAGA